jgi:hypothetical protein
VKKACQGSARKEQNENYAESWTECDRRREKSSRTVRMCNTLSNAQWQSLKLYAAL